MNKYEKTTTKKQAKKHNSTKKLSPYSQISELKQNNMKNQNSISPLSMQINFIVMTTNENDIEELPKNSKEWLSLTLRNSEKTRKEKN